MLGPTSVCPMIHFKYQSDLKIKFDLIKLTTKELRARRTHKNYIIM